METIFLAVVLLSTYTYLYMDILRRDKAEKDRFREFVIANKAKDITEYVQAVPNDEKFEIKSEDELVDLDQLSPEELLEIKIKENDNLKN